MSEVLVYRLQINKDALVEELEAHQVLDYLLQEDVLDDDKYRQVRDQKSRKEQAELLLSYIEKDSSAIQSMIDRLERSPQRYLACMLNEALPDEVALSRGILDLLQEKDNTCYPMTHVPCGYAVIINNANFDPRTKFSRRDGSERDVEKMEKLFKWLQFNVDIHEDKTAGEIKSIVRRYGVDVDHSKFDCFVLFLMSHGFPDGIYGVDGERVYLRQEVRCYLTADKGYTLANKPKLIFVQACRGEKPDTEFVVSDSPDPSAVSKFSQEESNSATSIPSNSQSFTSSNLDVRLGYEPKVDKQRIPHDADIIMMYAATAYYAALRNTRMGGWFVTELYNVMAEYASTEDLQSIITRVTRKVSTRKTETEKFMQCPEQIGNLRKKVFFNPNSSVLS